MRNEKFGFRTLAQKSFAAISAAIGALASSYGATAVSTLPAIETDNSTNIQFVDKNVLKPKLVLRLNVANPENSFAVMHTSHSSHSSHRSHSSHSSHYSSSYSSPSYYTPSTPTYSPANSSGGTSTKSSVGSSDVKKALPRSSKRKRSKQKTNTNVYLNPNYDLLNSSANSPGALEDSLALGTRTLSKDDEGKDVEALQLIIKRIQKDFTITGYFGPQTDKFVTKFQTENGLIPNGVVDETTLNLIRKKAYGTKKK